MSNRGSALSRSTSSVAAGSLNPIVCQRPSVVASRNEACSCLWGSIFRFAALICGFRWRFGLSCCALILARDPAEDWCAAELVASQVYRFWRPGLSLRGGELSQGLVRSCGVEMGQIDGDDPA